MRRADDYIPSPSAGIQHAGYFEGVGTYSLRKRVASGDQGRGWRQARPTRSRRLTDPCDALLTWYYSERHGARDPAAPGSSLSFAAFLFWLSRPRVVVGLQFPG